MGLRTPELIVILVIVVLVFGGAMLPKLARSIGEAQRELRRQQHDDELPPETPSNKL